MAPPSLLLVCRRMGRHCCLHRGSGPLCYHRSVGACVARLSLVWVVRPGHCRLRTSVCSQVIVATCMGMCDHTVVLARAGVCGWVVVTACARVGVVVRLSFVQAMWTCCHRSGRGVVAGLSLLCTRGLGHAVIVLMRGCVARCTSDNDASRQPVQPHTPCANVDYTPQSRCV